MAQYLSELDPRGEAPAEFWYQGGSFGVDVNSMKLHYISKNIVTGDPNSDKHPSKGILYYNLGQPIPLQVDMVATVLKDATDESGQPCLFIRFQNENEFQEDPENAITRALFKFVDTPVPDVFILSSGTGRWKAE